MSWVKLDDDFFDHIKVVRAGRDARDLYLAALLYASKSLTDGFVPVDVLDYLAAKAGVSDPEKLAHRLVNVHLWEEAEGGWRIHDWHQFRVPIPRGETHPVRREWDARGDTLRRRILERDGYKCRVCGSTVRPEVDHILSIVRGGLNEESNLQTLCRYHNRSKGAR